MLESVPAEAWTTVGGAGAIGLAIWRGLAALAKAFESVRTLADEAKGEIEAIRKHREAEAAHWAKEEAVFKHLGEAVLG